MQPIKTGILSYGMSGRVFHAPFLQVLENFHFDAVLERSKKIVNEKYPSIKSYSSLETLLGDGEIELIIVNTPNATHFNFAKQALQAGKHVVVEKPFTATVEEAEELIALAKANNRLLSVYHNRRYDSDFRTVKKVVEENWLGKLVEAEFHFDRYKEDLSPKLHKEMPGPGTGALYDLGSHIIDQALHLFGMPEAVFADIRIIRPTSQVDDYFEILLYYPTMRVRLHSSYLVREPLPAYILHGANGSFIKAKTDGQEEALDRGIIPDGDDWGLEAESERGLLHTEKNGEIIKKYIPSQRGNYGDYYRAIYKAIREKGSVPVRAEEALAVIKIIVAADKSCEEDRLVWL